jgi:hypothetical protein
MFRSEGNLGRGISVQRASPPSKKTRPHKAAGKDEVGKSLSVRFSSGRGLPSAK